MPPHKLKLSSGEVHIWACRLSHHSTSIDLFDSMLSSAERAKANGLRFKRHRERFIIGHGFLRQTLATYFDIPPCKIDFATLPGGKPRLVWRDRALAIEFSYSHSHDLALLAVSRDFRVGADVEYIREEFDFEPVVGWLLGDARTDLRGIGRPRNSHAFYQWWTQLEAIAKLNGHGIASLVDHGVDPSADWLNGISKCRVAGNDPCSICDVPGLDGYAASVAVSGVEYRTQYWQPGVVDKGRRAA